MPTRRKAGTAKGPHTDGAEFRFKIDAYTPETMPMARLAQYMAELAEILGERSSVHFIGLEPGSTTLVQRVEREAIPKVRERAVAVRRGDAPRDAQTAYHKINRFLREDNASAVLQERKAGPKILIFPGRQSAEENFSTVKQQGSIDGIVLRVGGIEDQIPVLMESEGRQFAGCHATKQTAKELAYRLFEPVRLYGIGYWTRDSEGEWSLRHFRITSFEPLENLPLREAVDQIRGIPAEWDQESYSELSTLRHGRLGNGGS